MKRSALTALLLGSSLAVAAVPVLAAGTGAGNGPAQGRGGQMFLQMDADGDGTITRAEYDEALENRFAMLDTDSDGQVTAQELKEHRDAQRAANGGERGQGRFGKHDGERFAMRDGGREGGHGKRFGGRDGHEGRDFGGRMQQMDPAKREEFASRMMQRLDQNGDGALSQEELATPPSAQDIFARLDTDGDGMISAEEFQAMRGLGRGPGAASE